MGSRATIGGSLRRTRKATVKLPPGWAMADETGPDGPSHTPEVTPHCASLRPAACAHVARVGVWGVARVHVSFRAPAGASRGSIGIATGIERRRASVDGAVARKLRLPLVTGPTGNVDDALRAAASSPGLLRRSAVSGAGRRLRRCWPVRWRRPPDGPGLCRGPRWRCRGPLGSTGTCEVAVYCWRYVCIRATPATAAGKEPGHPC